MVKVIGSEEPGVIACDLLLGLLLGLCLFDDALLFAFLFFAFCFHGTS